MEILNDGRHTGVSRSGLRFGLRYRCLRFLDVLCLCELRLIVFRGKRKAAEASRSTLDDSEVREAGFLTLAITVAPAFEYCAQAFALDVLEFVDEFRDVHLWMRVESANEDLVLTRSRSGVMSPAGMEPPGSERDGRSPSGRANGSERINRRPDTLVAQRVSRALGQQIIPGGNRTRI